MPATIRDVARIAGVSVTAAHRALNGKSELKSDKRERVLEAARELNYVPSAAARALVSGKTNTIGMVVTDNSSPVYAGVVRGVEEITNAAGYGLLLCNSGDSQERAIACLETLRAKQVDGVLITPVQTDRRDVSYLQESGIPYVLLMRHFAEIDSDYVITDNETGGYEATTHLLDLGHTRIGHVAGPECVSSAQGRMIGYRRALTERGVQVPENLIVHAPFTIGGGYEASLALLDRPDRPSAIFASNDLQAVGVMKAARALNLTIPDDLALVGGDDIELAEFLEVPLTTFHQPLREIGSLGAEILIERLRGEREEQRRVVFYTQIDRAEVVGMDTVTAIDPITFEVLRNALLELTEEMSAALRRSAYSTNIKTRADFSCALFDRNLQSVSQSFSQANHLGSLVEMVPRMVREYGVNRLGPGDALLSNDPYRGGAHLNDILLVSPIFHGGEIVAYVANLAHHVDVGGGAPASIGAFREVYQEGVIIPPVKLLEGGEIVPDVFALILSQVRAKHETAGDFRAQIAANATGGRRLASLIARHGAETVAAYVAELIAYTDRRTATELAKLPRGVFEAEGVVDSDGFTDRPVRLVARITVAGKGVLFDLTGSDPQRRAPVNSTYSQTFSACAYVLKCLIDPDVPVNAGFYRHVRLIAPPGTVVNAAHPGPVVGGWETNSRLTDVMLRAFATALPGAIPAGTKAMICHAGFGGVDPRKGEYYCFLETLGGGFGGRLGSDGPDAVQTHGQNTENAPIEETERNYPVRITRYELVENSDGAGQWRGGLGLRRDYLFADHEASFTVLSDRDRWGPWGLFGGQDGERATYTLNPDGEAKTLGAKATIELQPGDIVSYRTCGGGGYGPPVERDPALVLRDVHEGKVSLERAQAIYRVAIDPATWTIDDAATARLRGATR